MASSLASALPSVTLSPPILLRLYTLCVVATTASLTIWGPQLISSIRDLTTRPSTTPDPEPQADPEPWGGEPTEEKEETKTTENRGKKWKRKHQTWTYGYWRDSEPPKPRVREDKDIVFVAIERTWGRNSRREDYLWIEINSHPLTELLRFEFKHLEGLRDDDEPGVDARELYTARERMAELAALAPPEEEPQSNGDTDEEEVLKNGIKDSTGNPNAKAVSEDKANETDDTQPTERGIFPEKPAPAGPGLSKAEYNQALRELKLVTEFIKEEYQKVEEKLAKLTADGMISWKVIWAFFNRGQRLETTHPTTGEKMAFIMTEWKQEMMGETAVLEIYGRWLEWTGHRYVEQTISRSIMEFSGLTKLAELPVQHLSDESFEELKSRGRIYAKYAGVHHLNYTSNLIRGNTKLRAEGRLMIDVASYRRMNPDYDRWDYDDPRHSSSSWRTQENAARPRTTIGEDDEDLALLPPVLYGYSFVAKAWGEILVDHLAPVPFRPDVFNHLVLRDDYKSMIRSLVDAHAGKGESALLTDVITGKGGGLVIVLHGKPGIGKTLTAEAVSEHLERPLYIVSSGELGVEASYLEKSLKDTLEVATLWKAVTLIDEADVFLEARSSHELQRNALVSVFLRVLEYHSGVLILTTNRIRAFDDAFLSRFSIALRYPDLDQDSRKVLWVKFLTMAGALVEGQKPTAISSDEGIETPHTFSLDDIEKLSSWNLNGRVIKQSARTAQALAVSAGEPLSMSHVETVLKVSDQFAEDWKELTTESSNPRSGSL